MPRGVVSTFTSYTVIRLRGFSEAGRVLSRASTTRRSAAIYPISQVLHAMHSSERHQRTKRTKLKRCLNFQMSEAEDEHEDELPRP
jgi:hypothetical protein